MSLGPVMLDINGVELSNEDKEILQHPLVGGVILFTRNYENLDQLVQLVKQIHEARDPHLLVAVDHEGGRVQRFREEFTHLPAARRLGELYDHNHKKGKQLTQLAGWLMAIELRSVGIDFSFAPVLDLDYGICDVIGDRAFHQQPDAVYELVYAYITGMHEAGMSAVGKHFPGHGAVREDSHIAIPCDEREYDSIYQGDIKPYRLLIQNNLSAIMPAHVIYNKIDTLPAGFSSKWLKTVLRNQLKFQGVIFSDDLDMQGASVAGETYSERARTALAAGCDMVLVCNNRAGAVDVLDNLGEYAEPVSASRLVRMHGRHPLTRKELNKMARWHDAVDAIQKYLDDPSLDLQFT